MCSEHRASVCFGFSLLQLCSEHRLIVCVLVSVCYSCVPNTGQVFVLVSVCYNCVPNTGQVFVFSLDKYGAFTVQYVTEEKRFLFAVTIRVNSASSVICPGAATSFVVYLPLFFTQHTWLS